MDLRKEAERRVDAKIEFQENLYKYLIVNVILAIICVLFLHSFWLLFFVMFFWGIGLLDKFFKAYSLRGILDRESMIEKEISRMGD
ncbi:2TM domain-containing protein [Methanobrevibacter millerae]|uniref:2TM domain-containing protein n=1 Tax=Methanobrevibacter millerae TaxID=230361 RepID=A0A1G5VSI2_9EURY|nr:2TM domain-containing protein [Methanobrevibacter millerae]SDA48005.1 2TM domain-containing protein [Methanobrevibacter millerae]